MSAPQLGLDQIAQGGAAVGQLLGWNGSEWAPMAPGVHLAQLAWTNTGGVNITVTLPQNPDGNIELFVTDLGIGADYSITGNQLTTIFADPTQVSKIMFIFSY